MHEEAGHLVCLLQAALLVVLAVGAAFFVLPVTHAGLHSLLPSYGCCCLWTEGSTKLPCKPASKTRSLRQRAQ